MSVLERTRTVDLASESVRSLNAQLHALAGDPKGQKRQQQVGWMVLNPGGRHSIAAGLDADLDVEIDGHVGYYCAGMSQRARVRVLGNCGVGVAENMMSGTVEVLGNASQSAGASARGGMLLIHGNAAARCAISLKGGDVVVRGSIGHMGAFLAQRGRLVVCGDAGEGLGDSIYEAHVYVAGAVHGLGADCVEKEMGAEQISELTQLLAAAAIDDVDPGRFRRYGSARELYRFHVDDAGSYV